MDIYNNSPIADPQNNIECNSPAGNPVSIINSTNHSFTQHTGNMARTSSLEDDSASLIKGKSDENHSNASTSGYSTSNYSFDDRNINIDVPHVYFPHTWEWLIHFPTVAFVQATLKPNMGEHYCQVEIENTLTLSFPWPTSLDSQSWEKGSTSSSTVLPVGPEVCQLSLLNAVLQRPNLPQTPILLIPMPYPEAWVNVVLYLKGLRVTANKWEWRKMARNIQYLGGFGRTEE